MRSVIQQASGLEGKQRHVWDTRYFGGSNVVGTVIRSLRRKLGPYAQCLETVTGVGYRLRAEGLPQSETD